MAHQAQAHCSFSGRTSVPVYQSLFTNKRHQRNGQAPPRTVDQLIARLNTRAGTTSQKQAQVLCPPERAAVAERADTSQIPSQPLSTYSSRHRPQVLDWLETCIRDAVKNLDEAPFLQLFIAGEQGRAERSERHNVTSTVVQTPQLWRCIAEHLAQAEPEVLMLVHPLDMRLESRSQKDRIVRGKQPGLSDVMTGVTAHRKHKLHARQTLESLMSSGLTTPQFSGRVGEACCDDEVHSQIIPFTPPGRRQGRKNLEEEMNAHIDYWGVVVQSKITSEAQGCYVLKTVHSTSPTDCQCTHYTLTRVSRGEPLAEQLSTAWLV